MNCCNLQQFMKILKPLLAFEVNQYGSVQLFTGLVICRLLIGRPVRLRRWASSKFVNRKQIPSFAEHMWKSQKNLKNLRNLRFANNEHDVRQWERSDSDIRIPPHPFDVRTTLYDRLPLANS